MSHELRTPLNSVLGFAQILADGASSPRRTSSSSITSTSRDSTFLTLINEVLDISRVESGNIGLTPEPVLLQDTRPGVSQTSLVPKPRSAASILAYTTLSTTRSSRTTSG